jgi:hypothetical protein
MAVVAPIVSTWDNRGVRQAESAFGGLTNSAGRSFSRLAGFAKNAALAVGAIGVAAVGAAKVAIEAASDLAESQSKIDVIFGNSAKTIATFAATAAKSFGLSKQAVYDAAGTFGTFGKAAGLSGDDLANFATSFTGLAADLASFNNTTPEEAITAIGAALRGESEPLRRYGVLLDDASMRAKALELGIYDGSGALTAQQKILAAQALIWEQTSDAQGDFARTSKGLANQSRILKAQLANITAEIGQKLLPIALKLATFFNDRVIPAFQKLADVFKKEGVGGVFRLLGDQIKKAVPVVQSAIGKLAPALWEWIKETIPKVNSAILDWIGKAVQWWISKGYPALVKASIKLGDALVEWIKQAAPKAAGELGKFTAALAGWIITKGVPMVAKAAVQIQVALLKWTVNLIPTAVRTIASLGSALVSSIGNALAAAGGAAYRGGQSLGQSIINGLSNGVRSLVSGVSGLAASIGNAIVSALKNLWNIYIANPINVGIQNAVRALKALLGPLGSFIPIPGNLVPRLATGGIVDSPTLAVIGDRRLSQGKNREAVIPLDKMGGLGGGINITINGAIDPVATARQIRKILATNQNRLGYLAAV